MNTPSQDFEQTLTQLMEMYRSLALIREQVLPAGSHNFGLLAEGTLEHIRRLEVTVMELGGRREAEEQIRLWTLDSGGVGPELPVRGEVRCTVPGPQLQQAIEQLGRMCRVLHGLGRDVLPRSSQQFGIMAEGPLEEIRRLEATVRELSGHRGCERAEGRAP